MELLHQSGEIIAEQYQIIDTFDLREKIVRAYLVGKISIRKVATQFNVSKSLVQKLVKQQQNEGNLQPKQRGKP